MITTLRAAWRHGILTASTLLDRHFDLAFGTDTRTRVETAALADVKSPNRARGIRYEPTHAVPFRRVLCAAGIPVTGTFVDLGCGKGRVLMLAAMAGFPRVAGVDYSAALCALAERNLARFRERTERTFTARVLTMDAADYPFAADETVVFLFNPFDAVVLRAVLARLERSLVVHPRDVWIIYHNPVWREVLDTSATFVRTSEHRFGGRDFVVYRTR